MDVPGALVAVFFERFPGRKAISLQTFRVDKIRCSKEHAPEQEVADAFDPLRMLVEEGMSVDEWQEGMDIVEVADEELLPQSVVWKWHWLSWHFLSHVFSFVNLFVDDVVWSFQGAIRSTYVEDELKSF